MEDLRKTFEAIHPLNDDDWDRISCLWKPFTAKRKEMLTLAGNIEKYLYFVREGVQRLYYSDDQNREATLVFTYAPSFGGVLDSMMLNLPSRFYYETLTPSSFLRAPISQIRDLMEQNSNVERLVRVGITNSLSGLLERMVELQCFSAEERFRKLMQRSPHILQLVPHKYLANYLGIDPTNFSKLLNKIKI